MAGHASLVEVTFGRWITKETGAQILILGVLITSLSAVSFQEIADCDVMSLFLVRCCERAHIVRLAHSVRDGALLLLRPCLLRQGTLVAGGVGIVLCQGGGEVVIT